MADEAGLDQGIQAIIDRGHGDVRHVGLGADEDIFHRGVIALLQEDIINVLALRREPKAAGGQSLVETAVLPGMIVLRTHINVPLSVKTTSCQYLE
jgi:hypothetical protein